MIPKRHIALQANPIPPTHPSKLKLFPSDPNVCRRMEEWMAQEMPRYAAEENKRARIQFHGRPTDSMSGAERRDCMISRERLITSAIKIMDGRATAVTLAADLKIPLTSVHRTITDLLISGAIEAINPGSSPTYYREALNEPR